ncbi:hypothetical protein GOBAR_AA19687 [Gossypium barbadense]|uniref:Peroxisomal and mitochondrial division factor 2-like n=1 Tax=Gossypium barbadense TaxID=3634 RepID=A0A2P5XCB1_GOSBA|nr:hypothetical protein GOBAR_AA19687 [Gossypium barbadense]
MADSTVINGEVENQMADNFYDADEAKFTEQDSKIKALESEKLDLSNENKELKEKVKKATLEIDQLRNKEEEMRQEMDNWDEDKKVLKSVSTRSADLETEVARLQHDLITSMSDADEANKQSMELKRELEEKGKLGVLEVRESEERSKNVRMEEELRQQLDVFENKVKDLEAEVARTRVELETTKEEQRESEERAMGFKLKLLELKEVEKKAAEGINGKSREIVETAESKEKGLNVPPLVAAGSAAAIFVAVAAVYLCCRKRS